MSMPHPFAVVSLLVVTCAVCWLGALGMWRMAQPMQALHYLSFPAAFASITLAIAVGVHTGASQATAKCILIALILIGINSIVTHATARAFRVRELGHWEPRPGDGVEFLEGKPKP